MMMSLRHFKVKFWRFSICLSAYAVSDFRVLDLSVTDIADAGLSFLAAFSHIQSLNLFSTKVRSINVSTDQF